MVNWGNGNSYKVIGGYSIAGFNGYLREDTIQGKAWYKNNQGKLSEEDRQNRFKGMQERFTKETFKKMKTKNYQWFVDAKLNKVMPVFASHHFK